MLGNVVNTKFKPTLLQSICSMKIGRNRSAISESSSTDSSISKPKANLQNYECSFNIWEKKAKERTQHQKSFIPSYSTVDRASAFIERAHEKKLCEYK